MSGFNVPTGLRMMPVGFMLTCQWALPLLREWHVSRSRHTGQESKMGICGVRMAHLREPVSARAGRHLILEPGSVTSESKIRNEVYNEACTYQVCAFRTGMSKSFAGMASTSVDRSLVRHSDSGASPRWRFLLMVGSADSIGCES